jgi:hypothetical protein
MIILGVDPGTVVSGWAMYDDDKRIVIDTGVADNSDMLYCLSEMPADILALEVFEARGMALGKESIETIIWTGRFMQAWPNEWHRVKRSEVKLHLCGTNRAKDANVRQALIDKLGPPGTKKNPGPCYGVSSHGWAALAVAVYAAEYLSAVSGSS